MYKATVFETFNPIRESLPAPYTVRPWHVNRYWSQVHLRQRSRSSLHLQQKNERTVPTDLALSTWCLVIFSDFVFEINLDIILDTLTQ